jgi:hypothetical protein
VAQALGLPKHEAITLAEPVAEIVKERQPELAAGLRKALSQFLNSDRKI